MTDDDVLAMADSLGIQGVSNDDLLDFACLIENKAAQSFFRRIPDAWLILDRVTGEPVKLSITEPEGGWLSECYFKVPLYRPLTG